MKWFAYLIRSLALVLFTVFGTNMAFAVQVSVSEIRYFQTEITHVGQADDVGFAARAPPLATTNVAFTGGVNVTRGGAFALHGQKTVAALFGFGGDYIATNTGVRVGDSFVPSGSSVVKDGTVQLNQSVVTRSGEIIPAGSVVTETGGAIKVVTPDGVTITGRTDNLLGSNQLALPATNNAPNLVIDAKIQTQMTSRGWSRQNVDDVISDGPAGRTTDNRRPNKTDDGLGRDDTATVYGSSGNYVVVNDRTGEIVQVSGRTDPGWIDDGRIQWD